MFFSRPPPATGTEEIRLTLGRWLALALEFELAADILRTAIAPTWNEIGQLAAIVVLRTALNYFLQREIDHAADRHNPVAAAAGVSDRADPTAHLNVPETPGPPDSPGSPDSADSHDGGRHVAVA
jgi:hypothetical protein